MTAIYMERYGDDSILRSRLASIRMFLELLDFFEVIEAMQIATEKGYRGRPACFSYFCGVCWRKIERQGK